MINEANKANDTKSNLAAIEVIGKILIFTPVIMSVPLILYAIISGTSIGVGDAGAGYSAGSMIMAGIFALLYVTVQEYKARK